MGEGGKSGRGEAVNRAGEGERKNGGGGIRAIRGLE